jgi:hypothetical protein
MERFIHNENLKLWRRQLSETTDPKKRSLLLDLISKKNSPGPLRVPRNIGVN